MTGYTENYFDSNGNTLVDEFQVNTTTASDQRYSRAEQLDKWETSLLPGSARTTDGWGVFTQVVDQQGNPVGAENPGQHL